MSDDESANQDDIDKMFGEGEGDGDGEGDGESDGAAEKATEGSPESMPLDEIKGEDPNGPILDNGFAMGESMAGEVNAIYDIPVQISAVLGRSTMQVSQLLKLGRGAVIELDRKVGEAIDIYVNNRLVARGEVVVVEDRLGITMTEIVKSDRS